MNLLMQETVPLPGHAAAKVDAIIQATELRFRTVNSTTCKQFIAFFL